MNLESWNNFIINNSSPSSFLQSWQWGEFQEALGNKIYHLSLPLSPGGRGRGEGEVGLQALVIIRKFLLGRSYLEIPKGPIIESSKFKVQSSKVLEDFVSQIQEAGKKEKAVLARINPPYGGMSLSNFAKPEILVRQTEPEDTILVDLTRSEDELMQNMHEKSRYNIRLAQKKGVKVRIATNEKEAFEKFLELLEETTKRDGITSWPSERFWKFRQKFMEEGGELDSPKAELLIGELDGKILAAAIVMLFGDSGTYLYAASSAENRPANAPSLVLWEAIKLAKTRGKRWYDMWGIAPKDAGEHHTWTGITRFKTRYVKVGATGEEVRNIGTRDLVLDKKFYALFKLGKKLKG